MRTMRTLRGGSALRNDLRRELRVHIQDEGRATDNRYIHHPLPREIAVHKAEALECPAPRQHCQYLGGGRAESDAADSNTGQAGAVNRKALKSRVMILDARGISAAAMSCAGPRPEISKETPWTWRVAKMCCVRSAVSANAAAASSSKPTRQPAQSMSTHLSVPQEVHVVDGE